MTQSPDRSIVAGGALYDLDAENADGVGEADSPGPAPAVGLPAVAPGTATGAGAEVDEVWECIDP